MIAFLVKGLLRDRHRSMFPVIIVALGVFLTTFIYSWMQGVIGEIINGSARFDTGHLKIMTRAYDEIADQLPNDLGIVDSDKILTQLDTNYPDFSWVPRIHFGGLLDIPDENGETKEQGPIMGLAVDLFDENKGENNRLNISESVVRGHYPENPGEILISDQFAKKLNIFPGDIGTLVGATANGTMAIRNFHIVGMVKFGISALDRGMMIADIRDIRDALDMQNMSGEILGFSKNMHYYDEEVESAKTSILDTYFDEQDEFSLTVKSLKDQKGLGTYLAYAEIAGFFIVFIFVASMSIVLWNTSLMSGIRRYGEMGVRLAIGETKGHIYRSMIIESVAIGIGGSIVGTALGLAVAYYLQEVGFDISGMLNNTSMMINDVIRAKVTPTSYYIGFLPGLFATVLGTMFAGIGIFKRQTASLFKELEV